MASSDPKSPVRADHRFIRKVMQSMLGGKVEFVPEEFDLIGRVFAKAGGSWIRVFQGGSPTDIALLKQIIKLAEKKDYLTKKHDWSPGHGGSNS